MRGPSTRFRTRRPARAGILASLAALVSLLPGIAGAQEELATLKPKVQFETTAGNFVIEVDTVRAPLTAEEFLRYVREGFYDGLIIHRVVPGFVVQGGGYDKDYRPRPTHAPIPNESGNGLSNLRGTVGMARGDSPHSATSQFYINLQDNPGLNPLPSRWGYAVFGKVVSGMDVIDQIGYVKTGEVHGFKDAPVVTIVIKRARVLDKDSTPSAGPAAPAATPPAGGTEPLHEGAGQPDGSQPTGQSGGDASKGSPESNGQVDGKAAASSQVDGKVTAPSQAGESGRSDPGKDANDPAASGGATSESQP